MNRRQFVRHGALAGVAAGTPASAQVGGTTAPSDRIGVGFVGCGGMGRNNLASFRKNPDVEIVALCDVYQANLRTALEAAGGKARTYGDYRKLLENRDVQAVVISTPDHWHALMCVDACNAGKDVYEEKPVSNCIREGRLMVEAVRRNDRIVQVGMQQHSGTHFRRAVKLIQEGRLGKIHYVQCWNHEYSPPQGIGNPPDSEPPAGLDWDLWLGPAPKVPYNESRFRSGRWRWFFDYGGGKLTDWGPHLIGIAHEAMNVKGPLSAAASGGKYHATDNRESPDTLHVVYEYPGFLLCYSTLLHNTYGHNG
ncbi:MAG: Gfo/Idh/MocA family oxidoreductase, partial [Acidobacteria bacterium]|nr:Gfo/Idh/MocA family oxidoreductase [Acidobacteriota bacterium]